MYALSWVSAVELPFRIAFGHLVYSQSLLLGSACWALCVDVAFLGATALLRQPLPLQLLDDHERLLLNTFVDRKVPKDLQDTMSFYPTVAGAADAFHTGRSAANVRMRYTSCAGVVPQPRAHSAWRWLSTSPLIVHTSAARLH